MSQAYYWPILKTREEIHHAKQWLFHLITQCLLTKCKDMCNEELTLLIKKLLTPTDYELMETEMNVRNMALELPGSRPSPFLWLNLVSVVPSLNLFSR